MSSFRHAFASLRHRDFALFWSAGLVSNSGNWMQSVTVPYVLYELTGSVTWLGIGAFATFFPALAMGPVAGAVADRFERRQVLLVTQGVQMAVAFSLWALWVSGRATPGWILLNLVAAGVASGINITSWQSFVPLLVPRESLINAVRLNSIQFTAARAFGPAVAGLVLARFGPGTAFFANAVSFAVVIAALLAVRPRAAATSGGASILAQFREGAAYVRSRRALWLPVLTIASISLFGSSLVQLTPALATDEYGVGQAAYGLLVAGFGAGAIVGALMMGMYADRARRSRTALTGLFVFSSAVLVLAATPVYAVGILSLVAMGVAYLMVSVSLNTSIQLRVAESYRGRVVSIYLMGLMSGVPIGALVAGRLADLIGLRPTIALFGASLLSFAVVAVVGLARLGALDEALEDDGDEPAGARVDAGAFPISVASPGGR